MRVYVLVFCLFLSAAAGAQPQVQYAQSKEYYMQKRKEIQDEIAESERQLDAIKNDKKATLGQLKVLQNKLALRQNLIANINDEINNIDNDIKNSSREVVTLKQKLDVLKVRYAQSIRYAYATRSSYDMLAFLFSSNDFNDAMRRMKYLKKFREFRKNQVDQIHQTQNQLQKKVLTLNNQKAQKDERLNSEVQEKQSLVKETDLTNQVINELKGKEGEIMKNIERNRATAKRVNKAINDIIEREIAKAQKEAEEAEKKKAAELAKATPTAKPGKIEVTTHDGNAGNPNSSPAVPTRSHVARTDVQPLLSTPTEIALAENFEGNRGKLYWPVDKGYITDHFGVHPHPVEHQVMIENYGVDIQTTSGAPIKAVFEGKVSSIFSTGGSQQIVMITHGNYFTVYNGLAAVSVKVGDHVSTRQVIGTVGTNDEGQPTFNFQIWVSKGKKANSKLNPELWLAKPR